MTWRSKKLPTTWNTTRRRILTRDNHRCRVCSKPGFEVDHIIAAAFGGSDEDSNLWTLCKEHHAVKTSSELTQARKERAALRKRPAEKHPGMK